MATSLQNIEFSFIIKLNHALAQHQNLFYLCDVATNNNLRGLPIFFALSYFWFQNINSDRLRIALGLTGVCIATTASVYLQKAGFNFRLRPFIDPTLDIIVSPWHNREEWLHSPNSWPSDTATMYGALSFLVLLCRRRLGVIIVIWSAVTIFLPRALYGYHYPFDLLSGVVIGCSTVSLCLLFGRFSAIKEAFLFLTKNEALSSSAFVVFISEMSNLFYDVRGLLGIAIKTLRLASG